MSQPEAVLPSYIDSTMLTCFRACHRKFQWEFIYGLRPGQKSIDLHAGGCFASAIERVYKEVWTRGRPLDEALRIAHLAYLLEWGDFEIPELYKGSKTLDHMWWCVETYFEKWHPKTDHIQPYFDAKGNPTFETTFAIPLDFPGFPKHPVSGDPFIYSGRTDALGTFLGRPIIRDEKSGAITAGWSAKWDMRAQFIGYIWAHNILGVKVDTVAVRGINPLKTEVKTEEAIKQYSDLIVDRWFEQLRRDLIKLVECWNSGYFDYDFGDACTAFNKLCTFADLCRMQEETIPNFMPTYRVVRWNPLKVNPVEDENA